MPSSPLHVTAVFVALTFAGVVVQPTIVARGAPPSQRLPSDRPHLSRNLGFALDLLGPIFDRWALHGDLSPSRHQLLGISVAYHAPSGRRGAGLALRYAVQPMGRALHGLSLATTAEAAVFGGASGGWAFALGGEVGYRHLFRSGVFVGAAVGVRREWPAFDQSGGGLSPSFLLLIGRAFARGR